MVRPASPPAWLGSVRPPPCRVGFYDNSRSMGGTVRYLLDLVSGLDRERFAPVVIASHPRPWHARVSEAGAELLVPPPSRNPEGSPDRIVAGTATRRRAWRPPAPSGVVEVVYYWRHFWALRRLFRRFPVDLLHINEVGHEVAPIAARAAGVRRRIGTLHVAPSYDLEGRYNRTRDLWLKRSSLGSLHKLISVSEATRDSWINHCGLDRDAASRITVIHNAVDCPPAGNRAVPVSGALTALPNEAVIVGSVGRLDRIKGYDILVRSISTIREQVPEVHVAIAGAGPELTALQSLAKELGQDDRVHFLGFLPDPAELLERLTIYVQSSRCEAFPYTVLEALCRECPVVASRVGGIPEMITNGVSGLLVPPEEPDQLAEAIITLCRDRGFARRLAQAGANRVRTEFSVEEMVARTAALYDELLLT